MGQRLSVIYHRKNGYARAVNDPRDDDDDDDDFPAASQKKSSSSTVSKKLGRWMSRITRHRSATPSADVPAADVPADVPGETARDECETGVQSTHHWRDGGLVRRANAAVAAADGKVHTSEDYIHFLVPDLLQITNNPFYWGKIDRYGAERLLDQAPEGTFLLRDSAHDEYVFSVSFRKHGRVLHARIEQWDRRFSLDARDPSVFSSSTVRGLLEHYKDPSNCMFFEPTLAVPLPRNFVFSLQHTCRAAVCDRIAYEDVNQLSLPHALKSYLKEYHYKQRVRTRKFDLEN